MPPENCARYPMVIRKRGSGPTSIRISKRQKLSSSSFYTEFLEKDQDNDYDSYEDESNGNEDLKLTSEQDYPFKVLTPEQILKYMNGCIKEAKPLLQLPATVVRILLHHFHWDTTKLLEAYCDSDREKIFNDASIVDPCTVRSQNGSTAADAAALTNGDETCEICYVSKPTNMMYEMQCGHRFCTDCWNMYLSNKVMDEGVGQTIACAASGCPILVDDAAIMTLLKDNSVKIRYQHLIIRSFVQCHKRVRWRPSAGCQNVVLVLYKDCKAVKCTCGFELCFKCGHGWHEPFKCSMVTDWLKKHDEDFLATLNWISTNTKVCPKCCINIVKDDRCKFAVCNNHGCNATFCWVCRKVFDKYRGRQPPHNWCSGYEKPKFEAGDRQKIYRGVRQPNYPCSSSEKPKFAAGDPRALHQRFVFYSDRYLDHLRSFESEKELYESVKDVVKKFPKRNVQFFNQDSDQSEIFEGYQQDLESFTKNLSKELELVLNLFLSVSLAHLTASGRVAWYNCELGGKSCYCEGLRKQLVEFVFEGYENDRWELYNY